MHRCSALLDAAAHPHATATARDGRIDDARAHSIEFTTTDRIATRRDRGERKKRMSANNINHTQRYNIVASTSAAQRNAHAIATVAKKYIASHPAARTRSFDCLEIACGSGVHARVVCDACEDALRSYVPTDVFDGAFDDVRANAVDASEALRAPEVLDAREFDVRVDARSLDGVLAVNVAHISSKAATVGIFRGAARALREHGYLMIYGPFTDATIADGGFRSDGDRKFDASLRERDAENFGLVDVQTMDGYAVEFGLEVVAHEEMPANNLTLVFRQPR